MGTNQSRTREGRGRGSFLLFFERDHIYDGKCTFRQAYMKGKVQTVLGLLDPEQLGITLTHEHLLHNLPLGRLRDPAPEWITHWITDDKVVIENLGWIRQYPYCSYDNRVFSEETVGKFIKEEMVFFQKNGGCTIVDNGSIGLRTSQQHKYLEKLSKEIGINIILGSGFYLMKPQSPFLKMTQEDMEQKIREEILSGVDGSNIKCGVIGEIGCSWPLLPFQKQSLKASATVQEETGCPVIIHPGRHPTAPEEILRTYQEAGGRTERVVMSHLDRTFSTANELIEFASMGSFCELDLFGIEVSHYQHDETFDMPSDAQRINMIRTLVEEGYGEKILLSQDIHTKHRLSRYGGHGYSHILVNIVPKMLKRGLTEENVNKLLVDNPRSWLTFD